MARSIGVFALASVLAMTAAPASAGLWSYISGGQDHHHRPGGGSSSGGGPTSVPEPSDAVLFLLGAAGIVIGRRLQARKRP